MPDDAAGIPPTSQIGDAGPTPEDLLAAAASVGALSTNGKPPAPAELPPIGCSPLELRVYITAMLGLLPGSGVRGVERHGPYGKDSCAIDVSTPAGRRAIRFEHVEDIAAPAKLWPTVATQLDGLTLMSPKINGAQAKELLIAVLRLAEIVEHATHIDDTLDVLEEYVAEGDRLILPFGTPQDQYNSLGRLKARPMFDHSMAGTYAQGRLEPGARWAVIVAAELERVWIRKRELLAYLLHVARHPSAPSRVWDARIHEAGGKVVRMVSDRRLGHGGAPGGKRHELMLYLLPERTIATL